MKTLIELVQLIHLFVYEARNELQDTLDGIFDSTACKKRLQLSEALLLAPKSDLVTRKQNYWIKGD